jgi:gliding motility-associated-like protein
LSDTIVVKDIPEFSLGNDTAICSNQSIVLTAPILNASYLWSTGDDDITIVALPANLYMLSINKEGCFYQDSIYIQELLNPKPTVSGDLIACKNLEIDATAIASDASIYDWGNLKSDSKLVTITNPGIYQLDVTYINGCKNSIDFEIKESCPFVYYAPNTFTPDGDGLNDNFCVQISGYTNYKCLVYNRNGQLVFNSDSPDNCWNGIGCTQGIYRYSIRINDVNGRSHQKNGIVQLLK